MAAAAGLAASCLAPAAVAQPLNRFLADRYFPEGVPGYGREIGTTVLSRARPEYDPLGIRVGSFVIHSELTEALGYSDNVYGQQSGTSSLQVDTQGRLRVNSDWGRNSLGGEITFDDRHTPSASTQDRTDWTVSLGGSYDIGRDTLSIAYSHLSLHQDPTDIDARTAFNLPGFFSTQPLPFTLDDFRAGYSINLGRIALVPSIDYQRIRFSNLRVVSIGGGPVPAPVGGTVFGVPLDQSYRDRDIVQAAVTARYEIAPLRNALVIVRDTNTSYISDRASIFGPSRSSNAIGVLAGLDYASSAVWRYRVLVGVEYRDFNSPAYKNRTAPVAEGDVIWQPTGLTTVTGRLARTVEDAADESVSGYEYTSARLGIDHEYLRNVLLSGYVSLQRADYLQSRQSETLYGLGAGATYLVNRNLKVALTYDYSNRQADRGFGGNYDQNLVLLQFRVGI